MIGTRRFVRLALVWFLALLLVVALMPLLQQRASAAPPAVPDGLRVLRSDTSGILLELTVPAYRLSPQTAEGVPYDALEAGDLPLWSDGEGAPLLPAQGVMLGIPQEAAISMRVVEADAQEITPARPLLPRAVTQLERERPGSPPRNAGQRVQRSAEAYARAGFAPEVSARVGEPGYMRSQRFVQVTLFPFQYDPAAGKLRWTKRLLVELQFTYPQGKGRLPGALRDEGSYEAILKEQIANYDSAKSWRQPPLAGAALPAAPASAGGEYRIAVREEGVYRLTYADLISAGVPSNVDPRTLKVLKNGAQVAVYVAGEGDGVLNASDYLEFYAQSLETLYSDVNIYWLSHGGANGLRMATRGVAPAGGTAPQSYSETLHLEENGFYVADAPWGNGDHWFWHLVWTNPPYGDFYKQSPTTYTFTLDSPSPLLTATLQTRLYSYYGAGNQSHHAVLYMNGAQVADDTWLGNVDHFISAVFPASVLVSGTNVISLSLPNDTGAGYDIVLLNWFNLSYNRGYRARGDYLGFSPVLNGGIAITVDGFSTSNLSLYDVTNAAAPVRLIGFTAPGGNRLSFSDTATPASKYVAYGSAKPPLSVNHDASASNLRSTANGADYIVIVYDDFYSAVQPLVALRASQGMRAMAVRISDIYDEFSDGVFDATAIRSFLTYAYQSWQSPAPLYVVLVGDGNRNYRNFYPNFYGPLETTFVPPYLDAVDHWLNEVAVDNRYVNVVGSDIVPDMGIGRLPVRSTAETTDAVNKILAYETAAPPGDWRKRIAFYTDNYYKPDGSTDAAGNFYATANGIAAGHIPAVYTPTKVYYNPYLPTATSPEFFTDIVAARYAVTGTLSDGVLFANYIGHAAAALWAEEVLMANGAEPGVRPDILTTVVNGPRQPIVLELACLTGAFDRVGNETLAESFVRAPGRAAIADWASTGFGVNHGHEEMAQAFYDGFFKQNMRRLGLAINYSKAQLNAGGQFLDLVDEFTLLGDPALQPPLQPLADVGVSKSVQSAGGLAPGTPLTFTLRISNPGSLNAAGLVLTDVLPAGVVNPTFAATGVTATPVGGPPYVWTLSDLAPGSSAIVTVYAVASNYFYSTATWSLVNTATISGAAPESNLENNVSSARIDLQGDLAIAKSAFASGPITPGAIVTFVLAYTNVGGIPLSSPRITDIIPAELVNETYWSSGPGLVQYYLAGNFVWGVSSIAPGQSGRITITADVGNAFTGPLLVNTARIGHSTPDINPANNVASVILLGASMNRKSYLPMIFK